MKYLTPQEISEILKISQEEVNNIINNGLIKAVKVDDNVRVKEDEFKDYLSTLNNYRSSEDLLRTSQEKNAYILLVDWLQTEIHMLSEIYRDLERVFEHTVEHLKGHLEHHRKAGDHHNERDIGNYILQVFDHWDRPRRRFQSWYNDYENRWYRFQDRYTLHNNNKEDNLEFYVHHSEWPNFHQQIEPVLGIPSRAYQMIDYKKENYRKKYVWLKRELNDLSRHFRKFDKTINKVLRKLISARKKCSKNMDFKKGYLLNEIITQLYLHLEVPRKKYNNWLMGKEERWQIFKQSNLPKVRENEEISSFSTFTTLPILDSNKLPKDEKIDAKDYSDLYRDEDEIDFSDEF